MHRRDVLKAVAALPLLPGLPALPASASSRTAGGAFRRVRPTDSGWPSAAQWQHLNEVLGGQLLPLQPLFAPCQRDPASAACRELIANLRNPFYIGDQAAGTQVSGWLDAWTPSASRYAVKARSSADVQAAVNFAREHRLRLSVKGGGHSYQGTSNAPDSLLLWTRALNEVTLNDAFVPQGCHGKVAPVPAVTAGSGAMWIDLYNAVTTRAGRYVQGGGCTSVGVAGLVQSGGFGSFSKCFGTAAAGLLEAEVVTADGTARTLNACRDPELFWALKGGGGGSWGVLTRLTLRTHELPEFMGAAWGTIRAQSDAAFRTLIARFVAFYAQSLFNPHWGEQVHLAPDNTLKISMVCQGLDTSQTRAVWQPFFDWVKAAPGDFAVTEPLGAGAKTGRRWWDLERSDSLIADPRPGAPRFHAWWKGDQDQVGAFLYGFDSLWLPEALLHGRERARLVAALFAGSRYHEIELHINKGLAGAPAAAIAATRETATNPAVTSAFALAIIADGTAAAYPGMARPAMDQAAAGKQAHAIEQAAAQLRGIVPDPGSYVSESNFFDANWSAAFWGAHYPRLRTIKSKYDPDGLFIAHHGVGSEDWSADGFTRLT